LLSLAYSFWIVKLKGEKYMMGDELRFEKLLNGAEPSLDDYIFFVATMEKLMNTGKHWRFLIDSSPKLHWILQAVGDKKFQQRIQEEKQKIDIDAITKKYEERIQALFQVEPGDEEHKFIIGSTGGPTSGSE